MMMGTLGKYLRTLIGKYMAIVSIGLVGFILSIDLTINADEILKSRDGDIFALLDYSLLRLPEIVSLLLAPSALIATLAVFANLIHHHELVAMWNGRVSPTEACIAVLPLGLLLMAVQFTVDTQLVPRSLHRLNDWGVADYGKTSRTASKDGVFWLRSGQDIVQIERTDEGISTELQNITIFQRDDQGRLIAQIEAASVEDAGLDWLLIDVTEMRAAGPSITYHDTLTWKTDLPLSDWSSVTAHPSELTFGRLFKFVFGKSYGLHPPQLYRVWLHLRLSDALAPLLLLVLAVFLAQRFERGGSVGIIILKGIAFGFGYFIILKVCHALGEASLLPAIAAGWIPPIILVFLGASFVLHHESASAPYFSSSSNGTQGGAGSEPSLGVITGGTSSHGPESR